MAIDLARNPITWCRSVDPAYKTPKHIQLLWSHLWAAEDNQLKHLLVSMPPQHGKSTTISGMGPAYILRHHADWKVALASYNADYAHHWGYKAKQIFTRAGGRLRPGRQPKGRWEIKEGEGGMMTLGRGGSLSGHPCDWLVADDLIKNSDEARSVTVKEGIWDWWQSTAMTRMTPTGHAIVVATRWCDDDLTGRILNSKNAKDFTLIQLPAIAGIEDALGRAPGEALWPGRYDKAWLENQKLNFTDRWWLSLYQGTPTAAEGNVFLLKWMQNRYAYSEAKAISKMGRCVTAVDGAWGGMDSDYSAIAVWCKVGDNCYLLWAWRGQVRYPEFKAKIIEVRKQWISARMIVEDKASGTPAIQELRSAHMPIIPYMPVVSKVARAEAISPTFANDHVLLPDDAPWLGAWIDEHTAFPYGLHDDFVDTSSMAVSYLTKSTGKLTLG